MFLHLTITVAALLMAQLDAIGETSAVGSWIVDARGESAAAQHVAMTLSSQGSGVIAFTCRGDRAGLVLGLNKTRFRTPLGGRTVVRYEVGSDRAETDAEVVSEETLSFADPVARTLLAKVADAAVLSFTLPLVEGDDVTLVFRPVETTKALAPLRAACRIDG